MSLHNVSGEVILKPIEIPVIGMIVVIEMSDNPNGQWKCSVTDNFDNLSYDKDTSEMQRMFAKTLDGTEYPVDILKDVMKILKNDQVGKHVIGQVYVDYKLGTKYFGLNTETEVPITIESMEEVLETGSIQESLRKVNEADRIISITRANPADDVFKSLKEIIETWSLPLEQEERNKIMERGKTALDNYSGVITIKKL